MSKKKVVLFLVEGITDKIALGLILSRLVENEQVHFELTDGDLTGQDDVTASNIKTKVWQHVKNFLEKKRYRKQDLQQVIHLIDTDGAFVPDTAVVSTTDSEEKTHYSQKNIFAKNCQAIKKRNRLKRDSVSCLHTTTKIAGVPYQIFYFSRNLEHALHNQIEELTTRQKQNLSEAFEDDYCENLEGFVQLLRSEEIMIPGDYQESWEFIKQDLNSLMRGSNFSIFFERDAC